MKTIINLSKWASVIAVIFSFICLIVIIPARAAEGPPYKQHKTLTTGCPAGCEWRECKVGNPGDVCLEDIPCYNPQTHKACNATTPE